MQLKNTKKGFTLLELLIVIAILAVLGAIVIFLLNPVETLAKARDSQRIADLSTIKTALGIYLTATSSPQLDGTSGIKNDKCLNGGGNQTIWTSYAAGAITDATYPSGFDAFSASTDASAGLADGTGWLPVNLSSLIGGSPISSFPIDPTNTIVDVANATSTDLIYRYACNKSPLSFEINAQLESNAFTVENNRRAKDGGNNPNLYEVGSSLTILPVTSDF